MKWMRWIVGSFVFAVGMVAAGADPVTVAIMVPDSVAGSGAEVTDILLAELSASPDILLVDRTRLREVMAEQQLAEMDLAQPATAARVGQLLGARYLGAAQVRDRTETGCRAFLRMIDTSTSLLKVGYVDLVDCTAKTTGQALADETLKLIGQLGEAQAALPTEAPVAARPIPADWKKPSVMVIIPERHIQQPVMVDPAAETELVRCLIEAGFTVIDSDYAKLMAADQTTHRPFGGPNEASEYARKKGADVLLYGEAVSERGAALNEFEGCRARVELKAIATGDNRVLLAESEYAGATDLAEYVAGKKAIQRAVARMAPGLMYDLAERWNQAKP